MSDKQLKVMIVEDEVIIAMRIEMFLKRRGYVVLRGFSSGEQAVKAALSAKPDAILMDINLKGNINGIDAAIKINDSLKVPVIFMTGYSDDELFSKAKQTNMLGYFTKPVLLKDIIVILEQLKDSIKTT